MVVGDGDFASNSFLPYMANSDLALAMVRWVVREEQTPSVPVRMPVPPLVLLTKSADAADLSRDRVPPPSVGRGGGDRGVVEAAMSLRRLLAPAAAVVAVGLLVAMAVSGHRPPDGQFVKFAPAGLMTEAPAEIDRVELRSGAGRWRFVRGPVGWQADPDGPALPVTLAASLDDSIKFMHVSAPVRVMERAEWAAVGLREFGLDPPGFVATLYHGDRPVIGAEFGAPNPQQVLQYMKMQGRDQVYLMARFVGQEWEKALREARGG